MSQPGVGAIPYFNAAVTATKVAAVSRSCRVFFIEIINNDLTDIFLQVFDLASASVTVGTTTPTMVFIVPGGTGASNRGAFEEAFNFPIQFNNALTIAATTTATGSGAPTACQVSMTTL